MCYWLIFLLMSDCIRYILLIHKIFKLPCTCFVLQITPNKWNHTFNIISIRLWHNWRWAWQCLSTKWKKLQTTISATYGRSWTQKKKKWWRGLCHFQFFKYLTEKLSYLVTVFIFTANVEQEDLLKVQIFIIITYNS